MAVLARRTTGQAIRQGAVQRTTLGAPTGPMRCRTATRSVAAPVPATADPTNKEMMGVLLTLCGTEMLILMIDSADVRTARRAMISAT